MFNVEEPYFFVDIKPYIEINLPWSFAAPSRPSVWARITQNPEIWINQGKVYNKYELKYASLLGVVIYIYASYPGPYNVYFNFNIFSKIKS